jgi:hypothetical protein
MGATAKPQMTEKIGLLSSYALPEEGDIETPESAPEVQGLLDYMAVPAKAFTSAVGGLLGMGEGPSLGQRMALDTAFKQAVYDPQASPRQNMEAIRAASDKDLSSEIAGGFVGATKFHGYGPHGPFWTADGWDDVLKVLRENKTGAVLNAVSHDKTGPIALPYGKEGTSKSDGYGLAKIDKWHSGQAETIPDVLPRLPVSSESPNRFRLDDGSSVAVVNREFYREPLVWLNTIFKKGDAR